MNEDLQKELISILRELKNGASPAWQMLVDQRTGFYSVTAWGLVLLALALAIGALVGVRMFRCAVTHERAEIQDKRMHDSTEASLGIAGCLVAVLSAIGFVASAAKAWGYMAVAAYPLGELLGSIGR